MKSYRNLLLLFAISICTKSYAIKYAVECDNGFLSKAPEATDQKSKDCVQYKKNGYESCYDSKKKSVGKNNIAISTPIDHYYKSKESTSYLRPQIQRIISEAIRFGNDPYLSVAIALLENPPLVNSNYFEYASMYGCPPVDAIGVADVFNCTRIVEKQVVFNQAAFMQSFKNAQKPPKLTISSGSKEKLVCLADAWTGHPPSFEMNDSGNCCAHIKGISDKKEDLLAFSSTAYMKKRLAYAESVRAKDISDPAEKLAMIAQAFNGYGKFGVTEKSANNCLNKMDLGKTPLYGAGAGDLMLNSLMANSEIQSIVSQELKNHKKSKPRSYLCSAFGDGRKEIDGLAFSNLMQKYIGDKPKCPQLSFAIKGAAEAEAATFDANDYRARSGRK